jgi:hypothetical protein
MEKQRKDGDNGAYIEDEPILLPIIHDPSKVFGDNVPKLDCSDYQRSKYGFAKKASAFATVEDITLEQGESLTISTFFGIADQSRPEEPRHCFLRHFLHVPRQRKERGIFLFQSFQPCFKLVFSPATFYDIFYV